jgi:hypothetical protein
MAPCRVVSGVGQGDRPVDGTDAGQLIQSRYPLPAAPPGDRYKDVTAFRRALRPFA